MLPRETRVERSWAAVEGQGPLSHLQDGLGAVAETRQRLLSQWAHREEEGGQVLRAAGCPAH